MMLHVGNNHLGVYTDVVKLYNATVAVYDFGLNWEMPSVYKFMYIFQSLILFFFWGDAVILLFDKRRLKLKHEHR